MTGFGPSFLSSTSTSFFDLVREAQPEALPATGGLSPALAPEGTTVLALRAETRSSGHQPG